MRLPNRKETKNIGMVTLLGIATGLYLKYEVVNPFIPDTHTFNLKHVDNLVLNRDDGVVTWAKRTRAEAIDDMVPIMEESSFEEAWGEVLGLEWLGLHYWFETGTKNQIYNMNGIITTGILHNQELTFDLMSRNRKIRFWHDHPDKISMSNEPQKKSESLETMMASVKDEVFKALPSSIDFESVIKTSRNHERQYWGTAYGIPVVTENAVRSNLGVLEFWLTPEGKKQYEGVEFVIAGTMLHEKFTAFCKNLDPPVVEPEKYLKEYFAAWDDPHLHIKFLTEADYEEKGFWDRFVAFMDESP